MEKGSKLSAAFGLAIMAFALSYALFWCTDPVNLPIESIIFAGERRSLSYQDMQEITLSNVTPGFFRLRVSYLQSCLLSIPWLKQVDIRKVWPNKLIIKYEEHAPAARWGEKGIISTAGTLFFPKEQGKDANALPFLKGPDGRNTQVWMQYLSMKSILATQNMMISELILAPRGSWELKLNNGITVILGTDDILKRLKRFVRVYQTHLQSAERDVAYVDLRYTSGLSVGWKSG